MKISRQRVVEIQLLIGNLSIVLINQQFDTKGNLRYKLNSENRF